MVKFEEAVEKFDIKGIVTTMILSAFGFLVALQWRDAIKDTIDTILPAGEGLYYKYMAAVLVTAFAVVVTYILVKIQKMNIIPDAFEEKFKDKSIRKAKRNIRKAIRKANRKI